MAWQIAITLAAIGALVLFHGAVATEEPAPAPAAAAPPAEAAVPHGRDPWARVLVVAACAAALLALGVIVVPAVTGNEEAASTSPTLPTTTITPPTTSSPPPTTNTSTTTSTTSTSTTSTSTTTTSSTTKTTTIHITTTNPTTTPATTPPPGSALLVRATVKPNGNASQTVNRLGQDAVVRRTGPGEYRIRFPGLTDASRARSAVSVSAGGATAAVAGWAPNGTLVVLLFDRKTGEPVSRRFTFGVSVPELPPTR